MSANPELDDLEISTGQTQSHHGTNIRHAPVETIRIN
jgi:hypothetical protein